MYRPKGLVNPYPLEAGKMAILFAHNAFEQGCRAYEEALKAEGKYCEVYSDDVLKSFFSIDKGLTIPEKELITRHELKDQSKGTLVFIPDEEE